MARKTTTKKITVGDVNNAVSEVTLSQDNITKLERAIKRLPDKDRLKWYLDYRKMLLEEKKFELQQSREKSDKKNGANKEDIERKRIEVLDRAMNHMGVLPFPQKK